MQEVTISNVCKNIINIFGEKLEEIELTTRFVKREVKITARLFVETLVFGAMSDTKISLEGLCCLMRQKDVSITKQGLQQRFDESAVQMLKELFLKMMHEFKTEKYDHKGLLKTFSAVNILDSSSISLPEDMKDLYRGVGGGAKNPSTIRLSTWRGKASRNNRRL